MNVSKNKFDKQYEQRMALLKTITPEKAEESVFFKQYAFGRAETGFHTSLTTVLGFIVFFWIGFKMEVLVYFIRNAPTLIVSITGHGPVCIFLCAAFFIFSLMVACLIKYIISSLIGMAMGLEMLNSVDDWFLYDIPANPLNVPSVIVIERPNDPGFNAEKILTTILDRLDSKQRIVV